MLEKFEKIYSTNESANHEDWTRLFEWLTEHNFPNTSFLPEDYVSFMSESNGGIYMVGEREYQFLSLEEITEHYEAYMFAKFMPFAFPFAMDGCGNFYIFNLKRMDHNVYGVSAGNLGWGQDECFQIASSFGECLSQKDLIDGYLH